MRNMHSVFIIYMDPTLLSELLIFAIIQNEFLTQF